MPVTASSLSLADLEQLIAERQGRVETLLANRDKLMADIADIDAKMQELIEFKSGKRRRSRSRPQNETPLRDVVRDILGKKKKGLSIAHLAEEVVATGYQSNSQNFKNVLYQTVYNAADIVKDEKSGLYRLK